ncbi:MAG: RidA family protein [Dethiobacter sp.]|nr:RidA family protein [Dethiobacter sp.]
MSIKHHNPETVGKPAGPYTHLVETDDFVFMSGQAPIDSDTGQLFSGSFKEEADLVFKNIIKNLNFLGLDLANVVKVNAFLGDIEFRDEYNELYRQYFKEPFPARTTIVCGLGTLKIEIEVIAYKRR